MKFAAIMAIGFVLSGMCGISHAQSVAGFQNGRRILPEGTTLQIADTIPFGPLPIDDLREQAINTSRQGNALPFAVPYDDVAYSPFDSGVKIDLGNSKVAWRLRIESENALSINLGTRFEVPETARIFLLDAEGKTIYPAYTAEHNNWSGELWTPIVPGPVMEVYAEMHADDWEAFENGFAIMSINLAFNPLTASPTDREENTRSASCMIDVECPEGDPWTEQINGVARITIGGSGLCSGGLLNNTAQDGRNLFMTANHCGAHNNPAGTVAYWNFQNSFCRTPGSSASGGNGNGTTSQTSSGMQLLMTYQPADFTLLELNQTPPASYNVTHLGWNRSTSNFTDFIAIHHPSGDEKRISITTDNPSITSASIGGPLIAVWRANFSGGPGLQGGSSGSPGFDQNGLVRGTATGVSSLNTSVVCNTQFASYGRLNVAWNGGGSSSNRLRDWLDPLGTGQVSIAALGTEPLPEPEPFSLTFPANGATNIDQDAFNTFTWTVSENATSYSVTIATTPTFDGGTIVVGPIDRTIENLTVFSGTFQPGTTYYWTVVAENQGGDEQVSTPSVAMFTTIEPAPTCSGDINGDGFTDLSDFNILGINFGAGPGATREQGDLNDDGFVDLGDFNLLGIDFGCEP